MKIAMKVWNVRTEYKKEMGGMFILVEREIMGYEIATGLKAKAIERRDEAWDEKHEYLVLYLTDGTEKVFSLGHVEYELS